MKLNINTVLVGKKAVLVPYESQHVPKYHSWMLDEELRDLTASEPLTLEEEYEMQQKWQNDDDKLTFIIVAQPSIAKAVDSRMNSSNDAQVLDLDIPEAEVVSPSDPRLDSLLMVGDVNLFLHGVPSHPRKEHNHDNEPSRDDHGDRGDAENGFEAELEIMIAEPSYRRYGLAIEALQLILGYATGVPGAFWSHVGLAKWTEQAAGCSLELDSPLQIPPQRIVTRIKETNEPSIHLFEKLGFSVTKRVEVFGEVEMRWTSTGQ